MINRDLSYLYEFNMAGRDRKTVSLTLVDECWCFQPSVEDYPDWTLLEHSKCPNCPLSDQEYCPAAQSLYQAVNPFVDEVSFEAIELVVTSQERIYSMTCTMQAALSSLIGLVLPFSGCPRLAFFKPLARIHLPLSTEDETVFRVCSAYFLNNYFNGSEQNSANLEDLNKVYEHVREVNKGLADRVRTAGKGDSVANAVVILDCFASSVPYFAKRSLENLAPWFQK